MSSASVSGARNSPVTTSQTGDGWVSSSSASTAPRAGGQMPVSLKREETEDTDMKGNSEARKPGSATSCSGFLKAIRKLAISNALIDQTHSHPETVTYWVAVIVCAT